jgi:phosphogluconate dehydratase
MVELDAVAGTLTAHVPETDWADRVDSPAPANRDTLGRGLFAVFRQAASGAMLGASVFEPQSAEVPGG